MLRVITLLAIFAIVILQSERGLAGRSSKRYWLRKYNFQKTPNQGYFTRFFETPENTSALPARYGHEETRPIGSVSLHLLNYKNPKAVFHKMKATLIFSHVRGRPAKFHVINPSTGELTVVTAGSKRGELVLTIPGDHWFAVSLLKRRRRSYAILSSVAVPGTVQSDSVQADRDEMIRLYPQHERLIRQFT